MKYIKTYEIKLELKKYIIYKESNLMNIIFLIFEPISVKNNVLQFYRIILYRTEDDFFYNYKEDREKNNKKANIEKVFYDDIKKDIVFSLDEQNFWNILYDGNNNSIQE